MGLRCLLIVLLLCGGGAAQERKRLLFIGESKGFQHDSVSYAAGVLWKLGRETGLWDTFIRTDSEWLTKKKLANGARNLDDFDAVFFFTSGSLAMDESQKADLLSFVRDDGKGFLAAHSATDTFYDWPEYGEMIGAYFDDHPWTQEVGINVEDPGHPAVAHFGPRFTITDEIYQFRAPYSRDKVHVLMSVDTSTVDLSNPRVKRTDGDFAVTWVRDYGRGRVFYSSLGHAEQVWGRPDIQKMWVEAVRWAMGAGE